MGLSCNMFDVIKCYNYCYYIAIRLCLLSGHILTWKCVTIVGVMVACIVCQLITCDRIFQTCLQCIGAWELIMSDCFLEEGSVACLMDCAHLTSLVQKLPPWQTAVVNYTSSAMNLYFKSTLLFGRHAFGIYVYLVSGMVKLAIGRDCKQATSRTRVQRGTPLSKIKAISTVLHSGSPSRELRTTYLHSGYTLA